jgi:hypothetical protein
VAVSIVQVWASLGDSHHAMCWSTGDWWLGAAGLSASNLSWTLAKAYPGPESKWPCLNEASEASGWKTKRYREILQIPWDVHMIFRWRVFTCFHHLILVPTCSNMFRPCWARHATWDQPAMPRNQLRALLHPVILELPNTEMSTTFRNSFRIHQYQNYSITIHIHHLNTSIYILNRSKMM